MRALYLPRIYHVNIVLKNQDSVLFNLIFELTAWKCVFRSYETLCSAWSLLWCLILATWWHARPSLQHYQSARISTSQQGKPVLTPHNTHDCAHFSGLPVCFGCCTDKVAEKNQCSGEGQTAGEVAAVIIYNRQVLRTCIMKRDWLMKMPTEVVTVPNQ